MGLLNKGGQATAANNGIAEVDLTPPPGYTWKVSQIGINNNSTNQSICSVFVNQRFMCGSNVGNADAADGTVLTIKNGDTLRIVWNKCSTGAVCNVQLVVDEELI